MERFSRFVHTVDRPATTCDLTAITENVAAVTQRRVRLAGRELEVELPDRAVPVEADPAGMQRAIFSAILLMLKLQKNRRPITLKVTAGTSTAAVVVSGNADDDCELPAKTVQLAAMMSELQGNIETSWAEGVLELTLSVPIQ